MPYDPERQVGPMVQKIIDEGITWVSGPSALGDPPSSTGGLYPRPECPTTERGLRCWCVDRAIAFGAGEFSAQNIYEFVTAGDTPDAG